MNGLLEDEELVGAGSGSSSAPPPAWADVRLVGAVVAKAKTATTSAKQDAAREAKLRMGLGEMNFIFHATYLYLASYITEDIKKETKRRKRRKKEVQGEW